MYGSMSFNGLRNGVFPQRSTFLEGGYRRLSGPVEPLLLDCNTNKRLTNRSNHLYWMGLSFPAATTKIKYCQAFLFDLWQSYLKNKRMFKRLNQWQNWWLWFDCVGKNGQKNQLPTRLWQPLTRHRKICWPETKFRCSVITKLKFWVYLKPPRSSGSAKKWIWMIGGHICSTPCAK